MDTSRVSSKWQVVIPRNVREAEQIRVGSEIAFERTADGILLRPVGAGKRISAAEAFGILETRRRPATEADIARIMRATAARKERKGRKGRKERKDSKGGQGGKGSKGTTTTR